MLEDGFGSLEKGSGVRHRGILVLVRCILVGYTNPPATAHSNYIYARIDFIIYELRQLHGNLFPSQIYSAVPASFFHGKSQNSKGLAFVLPSDMLCYRVTKAI